MSTFKLDDIICITSQKKEQSLFQIKEGVLVAQKTNYFILDFVHALIQQDIPTNDLAQYIYSASPWARALSLYLQTIYGPASIRFTQHGIEQIFLKDLVQELPDETPNQFAFMLENQIKFCFSNSTEISIPPKDYQGIIFEFSNSKNKKNAQFYEQLTKAIKNHDKNYAVEIIKNKFKQKKIFSFLISKNKKQEEQNSHSKLKENASYSIISFNKRLLNIQAYKSRLEKEIKDLKLPYYKFQHLPFIALKHDFEDFSKISKQLYNQFPIQVVPARSIQIPDFLCDYVIDKPSLHPNLEQIGLEEAHSITKGKGVKVGIIDTGIEYTHSDLFQCFDEIKGYDFITGSEKIIDENGHGTHVAGIVGGITTGVAPECTLYSLRILNADGVGSEVDLLRALEWSIENKLDIINLSLGNYEKSFTEERALQIVKSEGISVICAAGNSGKEVYEYPSAYDSTVSVAAVNSYNDKASFSTYNDQITISAPGVNIFSTYIDNSFQSLNGTSMAAPHVTGVCALIKSLQPSQSPEQLDEIIQCTALKLGQKLYYGAGLVRADRAVNAYIKLKSGLKAASIK